MQLSSADDKRSSSRPVGTMPGAFTVLFGLARTDFTAGATSMLGPVEHGLGALRPVQDELQAAKLDVLTAAQA